MTALYSLVLFAGFAAPPDIDVGTVDQKEPPPAKARVVPKNDEGVTKVGLRASVAGKLPKMEKNDKATVYVLVNPLSNADTRDTWWVQAVVDRDGAVFTGSAQFGEDTVGLNEYFAVVVLVSEEKFDVGEKFTGLPKASLYSKLAVVKRTK